MSQSFPLSIFCRNVHNLRLRHGLSLLEMAGLLEITGAELAAIESGYVPRSVTVDVLFCIQRRFGIRPSQMVEPLF